ncbi:MAG: hypothetical protein KAX37_08965 [Opitutaceae bacterium]|nr:hypothetical protein [Opitutaceae bacterium]
MLLAGSLSTRLRFAPFAMLMLCVMSATPGRAVSVIPPEFADLVTEATQIVRVRVTEISVRWDPSDQGPVIHTYVRAQTLTTLKGPRQPTIDVRLLGGQIGEVSMQVADMPAFEVGRTYILFISGNNRSFCPLVGVMHGSYPLVVDSTTGTERVARSNLQPLSSVDDVALPLIQSGHPAFRMNDSRGLPADEFEAAIRRELSRASTN